MFVVCSLFYVGRNENKDLSERISVIITSHLVIVFHNLIVIVVIVCNLKLSEIVVAPHAVKINAKDSHLLIKELEDFTLFGGEHIALLAHLRLGLEHDNTCITYHV